MNVKVYNLKRYKIVDLIVCLIFVPIIVPLLILSKIGELITYILNWVAEYRFLIVVLISKIFKFEEVANKQYETNKNKLKNY